jgi:hypothetical protein
MNKIDLEAAVDRGLSLIFEGGHAVYISNQLVLEVRAAIHSVMQPAMGKELVFLADDAVTTGTLADYTIEGPDYDPVAEELNVAIALRIDLGTEYIMIDLSGE